MSAQIMTDIVDRCLSAPALFIVGIDGCGAAGKSTLATRVRIALADRGQDSSIIQMDDFSSRLRCGTGLPPMRLAATLIGGACVKRF